MEERIRAVIELKLKALTRLRVGSGVSELPTVDAPIIRYSDGRPYIPASTIKGRLRSIFSSLYPDEVKELFGDPGKEGKLYFSNADLASEAKVETTAGIAIDRSSQAVKRGRLYFYEYLPPSSELTCTIEATDVTSTQLLHLVDCLMKLEYYPIGRGSFLKAELKVKPARGSSLPGKLAAKLREADLLGEQAI